MAVDPEYGRIDTVATWPWLVKIVRDVQSNAPWSGGVPHFEGRKPGLVVPINTGANPSATEIAIPSLTSTYVMTSFEDGNLKTCDLLCIWFDHNCGGLEDVS